MTVKFVSFNGIVTVMITAHLNNNIIIYIYSLVVSDIVIMMILTLSVELLGFIICTINIVTQLVYHYLTVTC